MYLGFLRLLLNRNNMETVSLFLSLSLFPPPPSLPLSPPTLSLSLSSFLPVFLPFFPLSFPFPLPFYTLPSILISTEIVQSPPPQSFQSPILLPPSSVGFILCCFITEFQSFCPTGLWASCLVLKSHINLESTSP